LSTNHPCIDQAKKLNHSFDVLVLSSLKRSLETYINSNIKTRQLLMSDLVREQKAISNEKLTGTDLDEIKRLIKQYGEMRKFIIRLAQEYNKYCCIILYILKQLYRAGGLYDFYGKVFYLEGQ